VAPLKTIGSLDLFLRGIATPVRISDASGEFVQKGRYVAQRPQSTFRTGVDVKLTGGT
jgi:hypothetical protein